MTLIELEEKLKNIKTPYWNVVGLRLQLQGPKGQHADFILSTEKNTVVGEVLEYVTKDVIL